MVVALFTAGIPALAINVPSGSSSYTQQSTENMDLYRGDSRGANDVGDIHGSGIFATGLTPRGTDHNLRRHLVGGDHLENSAFISTSSDKNVGISFATTEPTKDLAVYLNVNRSFVDKNLGEFGNVKKSGDTYTRTGYLYTLHVPTAINVNKEFPNNGHSSQSEFAVEGPIRPQSIESVIPIETKVKKKNGIFVVDGKQKFLKEQLNPYYHGSHPHSEESNSHHSEKSNSRPGWFQNCMKDISSHHRGGLWQPPPLLVSGFGGGSGFAGMFGRSAGFGLVGRSVLGRPASTPNCGTGKKKTAADGMADEQQVKEGIEKVKEDPSALAEAQEAQKAVQAAMEEGQKGNVSQGASDKVVSKMSGLARAVGSRSGISVNAGRAFSAGNIATNLAGLADLGKVCGNTQASKEQKAKVFAGFIPIVEQVLGLKDGIQQGDTEQILINSAFLVGTVAALAFPPVGMYVAIAELSYMGFQAARAEWEIIINDLVKGASFSEIVDHFWAAGKGYFKNLLNGGIDAIPCFASLFVNDELTEEYTREPTLNPYAIIP